MKILVQPQLGKKIDSFQKATTAACTKVLVKWTAEAEVAPGTESNLCRSSRVFK